MAKGMFVVSQDDKNKRDINFMKLSDVADDEEQLSLRDEIDRTLITLRIIFKDNEEKFKYYFEPILSLAQVGLVGENASPALGKRTLVEIRNEVVAAEGGKLKNKYMRGLGLRAILLFIISFALGLFLWRPEMFVFYPPLFAAFAGLPLAPYMFLWGGCMCGVWLSFGMRKPTLKFEDLAVFEEDRLDPSIRLVFSGLLTIVIGLLLATGALKIEVGSFSSAAFLTDIKAAILIGMICGISEKALSGKVKEQAEKFLGK